MTFRSRAAHLPNEFVELLLAQDVVTFGVIVVCRNFGYRRLIHNTAESAATLGHSRSTSSDTTANTDSLRNSGGSLRQLLLNGHL